MYFTQHIVKVKMSKERVNKCIFSSTPRDNNHKEKENEQEEEYGPFLQSDV